MSASGPYRVAGGEPPPYVPEPLPQSEKKDPPVRHFLPPLNYADHPLALAMCRRGMTHEQAVEFMFKELAAIYDARQALITRGTPERIENWNPWE